MLVQLEHLRTLPSVYVRLKRGEVRLHGWVYEIETGEVFAFDVQSGQFVPIAEYKVQAGSGTPRQTTVNI